MSRDGNCGVTEVTLRYVRHHDVDRYLRAGWMITHGLMDCYRRGMASLYPLRLQAQKWPLEALLPY
jgi:hypothetical protein